MPQIEVAPGVWVEVPADDDDAAPAGAGDVPIDLGLDGPDDDEFEGPTTEDFGDYRPDLWEEFMEKQLGQWVIGAGVAAGEDKTAMANLFQQNWETIITRLRGTVNAGLMAGVDNTQYWLQTSEGWNQLFDIGKNFYSGLNDSLAPFIDSGVPRGGRRGGGGGGGRRALTAEEIRNSYDIDQLAMRADDLKRGLVLEGFKDPRAVARAYVDKVVAGKGQVKIDYDTFVEQQVRETGRFKSIFRNLPAGMDPRQYIAPLYAQALQVVPREAEARAIGAAQFGASAAEFQARLRRTDQATGSAPIINRMQGRLGQLKGILKG